MKISIIIIGFNSKNALGNLLRSINNLDYVGNCEVVYVDDGSKDGSFSFFQNYDIKYFSKGFAFKKNRGRVFARQKAVDLASGDWFCFLQSNVIVHPQLLNEYVRAIKKNSVLAVGGSVTYLTKDKCFEKYLNHSQRGVNKYPLYDQLCFEHLLFLNCMIHCSVFQKISFDLKFVSYGGKELDFSNRISKTFPNSMIACKQAHVTRVDFPDFKNHCLRLHEYGFNNFNLLSCDLKKKVIRWSFFLNNFLICRLFVWAGLHLSLNFYNSRLYYINIFFIKVGFLCSILCGYYKIKLFRISQN